MQYEDFEIDIRSTANDQFEAMAVSTSFQERPRVVFPPPLDRASLERLLKVTDAQVRAHREGRAEGQGEPPPTTDENKPDLTPRGVGQALYRALFADDLAELFLRCRAALPHDEHVGLRIRLTFHLDDPQAEYLAALPWELLCDPKSGEFLAHDIRTPVVRKLVNPQPRGALDVEGALRVLVVDAAPATMKKLDLKLEIERMEEALRTLTAAGEVELLQLPEASPEALRDALRDEVVHVLHFMGHGGYHAGSGMGALFFVAADGRKDQVDGETLGALLKSIPDLRLVVLNACKTARHAGRAGAPLYYGAASSIVDRTGIPAVVANQYAISDRAAIALSEAFYRRLAARDPVDTALSEARLQLSWRTSEWATPVLFLSAENGKIFGGEGKKTTRAVEVVPGRPRVEKPAVRVGLLSLIGWGGDMKERCDAFHDFTEYFDPSSPHGRFIREQPWWQEKVFPDLREFLLASIDERRPLHLDFAAHQSIAFAAGWVLEAKSGLDVTVSQRTQGKTLDWHPDDDFEHEGKLWQERDDIELTAEGPDLAVALSISNPEAAPEVRVYVEREGLEIGRIVDATIAPGPGQRSVQGGQHSLRLAQALVHRVRQRRPHERGGRLHLFGSAPNAFLFYLGQLSRSFGRVVLYEYPFGIPESYGRYQRSIELPPPDEVAQLPPGW
ncbi:MAG: CHAT domain-containing protein [bacterium]|nr:CHAT domain-containing protein [bacterium]